MNALVRVSALRDCLRGFRLHGFSKDVVHLLLSLSVNMLD